MPAKSIDHRKIDQDPGAASVQPLRSGIAAGDLVIARGGRARVQATVAHANCEEIHLGTAGQQRTRILLYPFDRPTPIIVTPRLRAVRARAWVRSLLTLLANEAGPLTPAGRPREVRVIPYQLSAAIAMARGTARILIADEVGLGKTIQAGWIVSDVVTRDPAARVLVAVPAGVRAQWVGELSQRFGVDASEVTSRWMRTAIADLPADVSPWTPPGVYVISLDFLKRPDVAQSARQHAWSLLVVDEAHTAVAPTERHAALASIAASASRLVLITATPYSGDAAAFGSLVSLGALEGSPPLLMFRRGRHDVGDSRVRRHRFAAVQLTRGEAHLQRLLERYSRRVWDDAPGDVPGARLAMTILRKRALSSPAAAARSLRRRLDLLTSRMPIPRQLALFEEDEVDDDLPAAALGTPGFADAALEERWLRDLIEAADSAAKRDSKLHYLQRLLRRVTPESAVVFTEYRDSLLYLAGVVPPALHLHGGLTIRERVAVQERFNAEGGLLLATDAAAEGLNLHRRCRLVINYELPWNPARLEQRIGRVDRIGQSRTVHAITLTARDTAEDLVIANVARRLTRVVATLGPGDRLGGFLDDMRVASMVIAGSDGSPGDREVAAFSSQGAIVRARPSDATETLIADQIRASTFYSEESGGDGDIRVTSVGSNERIEPGAVIVFEYLARTADGCVVARTARGVHLNLAIRRHPSTSAARAAAESVLRLNPDLALVDPSLVTWFSSVCGDHYHACSAAMRRAERLSQRVFSPGEVQPGLFDRRAVLEAEAGAASHAALDAEHRRHAETLDSRRRLYLSWRPAAVLLVWR